jgi:pimeloyl-ACP methyl ester carboxylesterase
MENQIKKPSQLLHLTEIFRSLIETIRGFFYLLFAKKENIGQGRVVMVVPGLLTSDFWTVILRKYLTKKGFQVYGWEMGTNFGRLEKIPELITRIETIKDRHQQKIILLGWSMGGLFSREVSHQRPDLISKVMTLGSPFGDVLAPNNAKWVFELLNDDYDVDHSLVQRLASPTIMPSVAFYSLKDGIVPWAACMDKVTDDQHINVEISSSHFGMGANPSVLDAVLKYA